jgi:hypothetical protein
MESGLEKRKTGKVEKEREGAIVLWLGFLAEGDY